MLIGAIADQTEVRGNLISGNLNFGIEVVGDENDIVGNRIGVNFSSDAPLPNGGAGIYIGPDASATIIGGDTDVTPGLENIIAGNTGAGVLIDGSDGNVVQGNLIGTNTEGTDLGNGGPGVLIAAPGQLNRIGADQSGTTIEGAGNTIAYNGGDGVELVNDASPDADFNEIHSNAIHSNDGLGIDLNADGVTPNDAGDGDDGANDLKNFPDLVEGSSDGYETVATITSTTAEPDLIIVYQLFVSPSCDASDHGEGERYLATVDTTADGTGFASASVIDPRGPRGPVPHRDDLGRPGPDVGVLRVRARHIRRRHERRGPPPRPDGSAGTDDARRGRL